MIATPIIATTSAPPFSLEIFSPQTNLVNRKTNTGAVYWSTMALAAVVSLFAATNALIAAV